MLTASSDPIAAMVQAHLATLAEPNDGMSLFVRERRIIRSLYDRGMPKQMIGVAPVLVGGEGRLPLCQCPGALAKWGAFRKR